MGDQFGEAAGTRTVCPLTRGVLLDSFSVRMRTRRIALLCLFLLPLSLGCAQAQDSERNAQIVSNLKVRFPELENLNVTVQALAPSETAGLDEGILLINGQQQQLFLVTEDNKRLYLTMGPPIDVSLDDAAREAQLAERRAQEAQEARELQAFLASETANRPVRGNPDGAITIVEFSDFQCPYCARAVTTMETLLSERDDIRFVYMHLPLGNHPWAEPAAIATECAAQQSPEYFWEMHDALFAQQQTLTPQNIRTRSAGMMAQIAGADASLWAACMDGDDATAYANARVEVQKGLAVSQQLGLTGTPAFYVNGYSLRGALPIGEFRELIDLIEAETR